MLAIQFSKSFLLTVSKLDRDQKSDGYGHNDYSWLKCNCRCNLETLKKKKKKKKISHRHRSVAWELIPFFGHLSQRGLTQLSQYMTQIGRMVGSI